MRLPWQLGPRAVLLGEPIHPVNYYHQMLPVKIVCSAGLSGVFSILYYNDFSVGLIGKWQSFRVPRDDYKPPKRLAIIAL
jgi:hypothetical protein